MRRARPVGALLLLVATLLPATAWPDEELPPENREWVEISIFNQCTVPPWGKTRAGIRPFFHKHGIPVYNFREEGRTVCAACSCPSDSKQLIQVRASHVPRVRKLLTEYPGALRRE